MAQGVFYKWDELDWIVMDQNMRRKQVWSGKIMNVRMEIQPGTIAPVHKHFHVQTGHLLQGRVKMKIADQERMLDPGDGYIVPPDVEHNIEVLGDVPAILLETFTPPREDLIVSD